VPFALPLVSRRLAPIAGVPTLRTVDGRPFITDNGNVILDCAVGPIADPDRLEQEIHTVPGVVGTGLFVGIAHTVLVGEPSGVKELRRRDVHDDKA
jgi:ribose 5-phosphate isomerase A